MSKVCVYSNYTSLEERLKKVTEQLDNNNSVSNDSSEDTETLVIVDSATTRGRGLTQIKDIYNHHTNKCAPNPLSSFSKKNTTRIGALVISGIPQNASLVRDNYIPCAFDDRDWISRNFSNPSDSAFTNTMNCDDVEKHFKNEENFDYDTRAVLMNNITFHTLDNNGMFCFGRVFRLEILEAALGIENNHNVQCSGEFLQNYLALFKESLANPFDPFQADKKHNNLIVNNDTKNEESKCTGRVKTVKAIDAHLLKLDEKIKELIDRKEWAAAKAASDMVIKIRARCLRYEEEPEYSDEDFCSDCSFQINSAQDELQKHRGFTKVLYNLAIAIVTLFSAHLYNAVKRKDFFFNPTYPSTDTMKKIKALKEQFNVLQENGNNQSKSNNPGG